MENDFTNINSCEVCGNKDLVDVLNLGSHPLCDDLIQVGDRSVCDEYPIEIVFCNKCKTAHQKTQISKHILFKKDYHYRSKVTQVVLDGLKDLVESYLKKKGKLKGLKVLDIGCNDGGLLDFFKEKGSKTYGIEPSTAALEAGLNHNVIMGYFDNQNAKTLLNNYGPFDLITFTNVFAHIEDLPSLLKNINSIMSDKTTLIIENHYLVNILQKNHFDTFYHEHPRTYSFSSFKYIAKKLNRNISGFEFTGRDGGDIRVFISNEKSCKDLIEDVDFFELFKKMNRNLIDWKISKLCELGLYFKTYGTLPAKAFPGRATILVKLLGLTEHNISAVYEIKGSIKTGYYLPGTRIPILPQSELFKEVNQKPIINFAWHIPLAVRKNLIKNKYFAPVIDIK